MNIFLTIPQGQCVRDFLILGIIDRLLDLLPDSQIVILTPAYKVKQFLDLCSRGRVHIRRAELPVGFGPNTFVAVRRRILRRRLAIKLALALESRWFQPPGYLLETFREFQPCVVVTTHPMPALDYQVVMAARQLGIQTIGVVKSWDNVGKGLGARPHLLSVWNPINRGEAISLQGYTEDEVKMNGAPSFDIYFDARWSSPREAFFRSLGLDPSRPVITYATAGVYDRKYYGRDETYLAEDLLRMIMETPELRGAQLVIRLHPTSRLDYFWRFRQYEGVALSFASYMPTIGWCPTREDLIHQSNLLKHSDVIVTPASSWAIEAAIFDTPVVVPVYSDIQPLHSRILFDEHTLAKHFRPLVENQWVPICSSYEQTRDEIVDGLTKREKYSAGRKAIVDNYVYYRDADSAGRVAGWIVGIAQAASKGELRGI